MGEHLRLMETHLEESFRLYDELVAALTPDTLRARLPVPSNSIGSQLWCVVGGRESWARAIEAGSWRGFTCSITEARDLAEPAAMARALSQSAAAVRDALRQPSEDAGRADLALRLLVHEAQHQGQLLRYLLGLGIEPPPGWRERFAL